MMVYRFDYGRSGPGIWSRRFIRELVQWIERHGVIEFKHGELAGGQEPRKGHVPGCGRRLV